MRTGFCGAMLFEILASTVAVNSLICSTSCAETVSILTMALLLTVSVCAESFFSPEQDSNKDKMKSDIKCCLLFVSIL